MYPYVGVKILEYYLENIKIITRNIRYLGVFLLNLIEITLLKR